MTKFVKKSEINCKWYEIDAKNAVVGRLATIITKIIRGKNSPKFSPHMDHGDFVVVKNIEHIKFTGNKFENKKYFVQLEKQFKINSFQAKKIRRELSVYDLLKMKDKANIVNLISDILNYLKIKKK